MRARVDVVRDFGQLVDGDVSFAFKTASVGFAEVWEQVGAFERPHLLAVFHHTFESVVP